MNHERIENAARTMQAAAEQMQRVYEWWSAEQHLAYERNLELVARLEAAAAAMAGAPRG